MNIVIIDPIEKAAVSALRNDGLDVFELQHPEGPRIQSELNRLNAEVLVTRASKVPASALEGVTQLRLIIRAGSGVDTIDVEAATRLGMAVCNCPGMNAVAVAELTFGLLLACDRRIPDQVEMSRSGEWRRGEFIATGTVGARGLSGMSLGVLGVGKIGLEVIQRARAFGMKPIAWSRSLTSGKADELGCQWGGNDSASLLEMAAQCDAISVHLPASPSTNGLLGAEFFGRIRPGAYFINTSRAELVDEDALRAAVETRKIRAGLDVVRTQPKSATNHWHSPISQLPGCYVTQYCGASTHQSQAAIGEEVVRIVRGYRDHATFLNRVN